MIPGHANARFSYGYGEVIEMGDEDTGETVAAVLDGVAAGAGMIPGPAGVIAGGLLRLVAGIVRTLGPGKAEAAIRALGKRLEGKPGITPEELAEDRAKVLRDLGVE